MGLDSWLNSLSLSGPQSRARSKFLTVAGVELDRAEKERLTLLDEYADKDDKGELVRVIDEKTGQENFHVTDDKMAAFNVAVAAIFDKEAILTTSEFAPSLMIVRDLVLNTEEKIPGSLSLQYSEWCDAFEKLTVN